MVSLVCSFLLGLSFACLLLLAFWTLDSWISFGHELIKVSASGSLFVIVTQIYELYVRELYI